MDAAKKHLEEQVSEYGEASLVSLVNHKGYEKPVKEAYERTVTEVCSRWCIDVVAWLSPAQLNLPSIRYEYFDFHNECKHMRWDRISVLIDKMEEDLKRQGCAVSMNYQDVVLT